MAWNLEKVRYFHRIKTSFRLTNFQSKSWSILRYYNVCIVNPGLEIFCISLCYSSTKSKNPSLSLYSWGGCRNVINYLFMHIAHYSLCKDNLYTHCVWLYIVIFSIKLSLKLESNRVVGHRGKKHEIPEVRKRLPLSFTSRARLSLILKYTLWFKQGIPSVRFMQMSYSLLHLRMEIAERNKTCNWLIIFY